jgi:aspartate aminotransferase
MNPFAARMAKLDASGIRKVFDLAAKMEDPINLSIGQPDFEVPDDIKEAAIQAIRDGHNRYTMTQGIPELHNALRTRMNNDKGFDPDGLLVTSGVSGGLILAFLTLLNPGDEVLVPDPYFVMYKHLVNLADGKPVFVDTYPDFKVTAERLRAQVTDKTKMILLNTPANPTGALIDDDELPKIAELAREKDLIVLSDEIYDCFSYEGAMKSIGAIYPKTLVMGGFSKSHAMTGWRLGYVAGPADIIQEMTKLQQFSFVCAPSMVQYAGVTALGVDTAVFAEAYRKKRDLVYGELVDAGYEVQKPGGAFYIFPKAPWGTGMEFVSKAIENELLIIPGSVFSERDTHFRISYAASEDTLEKGLSVLRKIIKEGPSA